MEYPLGKDPKSGGPPHGLESKVYEQLFAKPGQEIKYDSDRRVVKESRYVRVVIFEFEVSAPSDTIL